MTMREKKIVKVSFIGIISNVFLSIFKFLIGFFTNSIAITLDAVNNLSDVLSSTITIVGTKLANKQPDKKHPFGHGRIEYLSALIISIIILYAGVTSISESIKKIINPELPKYNHVSLIIIAIAIFVKIILGIYTKKVGEKVKSDSLVNSGFDALMDAFISLSTLVAAIIYILKSVSIESYLGILISLFIIKSGISMVKKTLSQILGERIDSGIAKEIKNTVNSFKQVHGAYDLMLNNYGPEIYMGSIHIEVDDTMSATEIDELTRKIIEKVLEKNNVLLSAIGIYSFNTKDKELVKIRSNIEKIVYSHKEAIQIHGFYVNKVEKEINFDLIIDYDVKDRTKIYNEICNEIKHYYSDYKFNIIVDIDASD